MKTAHIILLAAAALVAWMLFQSGTIPGITNPVSTDPRGGTGGGSDPGGSRKGDFEIMPISTDFDDVVMTGGGGSAGSGSRRNGAILHEPDRRR